MPARSFYLKRGDKTSGPYSIEQIKSLNEQFKMKPTDLISKSQHGPWTEFSKAEKSIYRIEQTTNHSNPTPRTTETQRQKHVSKFPMQPAPAVHAQPALKAHEQVDQQENESNASKPKSATLRWVLACAAAATFMLLAIGAVVLLKTHLDALNTPEAIRQRKIAALFSDRGVCGPLNRLIRESLNDPTSFRHVATSHVDLETIDNPPDFPSLESGEIVDKPTKSGLVVEVKFRAMTNDGRSVLAEHYFHLDYDGNILHALGQEPSGSAFPLGSPQNLERQREKNAWFFQMRFYLTCLDIGEKANRSEATN